MAHKNVHLHQVTAGAHIATGGLCASARVSPK